MRNAILAGIAGSIASRCPLASVVTRLLGAALLATFASVAFDSADAASKENHPTAGVPGEVRLSGAVLMPAGSYTAADVRSITALPVGQAIRRGSTDPGKHDPLRTVVVQPPRKGGGRVVLITYY
jgi:hypothetical protein